METLCHSSSQQDSSTLPHILNKIPVGILVFDDQATVQFVNSAASDLLNQPVDALVSTHYTLTPVECKQYHFEYCPVEDANPVLFEASLEPIQWNQKPAVLVTFRKDESNIVNNKGNTRDDEQSLTCRILRGGELLGANAAFLHHFHLSETEISDKNIFDYLTPAERLRFEVNIALLDVKESTGFVGTLRQQKANKEQPCRLSWKLDGIKNDRGEITEISVTANDVSAWNLFCKNLHLPYDIIHNASEGIMITDTSLNILAVNKAFSKITGYRPENVINTRITALFNNLHTNEFFADIVSALKQNGCWQGEIWSRRKNSDIFPSMVHVRAIHNLVPKQDYYVIYLRDISSLKEVENNLRYSAYHDSLTNLPNRSLFQEKLGKALVRAHNEQQVAVLYLDLDGFKTVNDSFGHDKGDVLLKAVSERLSNVVRQGDTVFRMGGDEFTIVLEGLALDSVVGVSAIAQRIINSFSQPFNVDHRDLYITPSIGISSFPNDGKDVVTLLRNADIAMYRAKELGKNNYQFYSQELRNLACKRLEMERDLRLALERGEFQLEYQPIVDFKTRAPIGIEALIRWKHPTVGMIYPNEFIPFAESNGLISPIGDWVLRTACWHSQSLINQGIPPLATAVNISARQLSNQHLLNTIEDILSSSKMPSCSLVLEITESVLMENLQQTADTLKNLRDLGVRISIDDFGTGYSSLNSLMRLPIDSLKIDKSFIADITNNQQSLSLVRGIISIGHNLELNVVAEGVETGQQADLLIANGCDHMQGYHFGRPMSYEKLLDFLRPN
jgi:diguanylate cyclase (GGDEF)-like protein/PAS domain S-box-containing protein